MKTVLMILGLVVMLPLSSMNANAAPIKNCSVGPCGDGTSCTASGTSANCECKAGRYLALGQFAPSYAACSSGGMLISHDGVPPAVDGYDAILQHNDAIFSATPAAASE